MIKFIQVNVIASLLIEDVHKLIVGKKINKFARNFIEELNLYFYICL